MTWDEMKNRISLALKDPILQRGFEIICKNLNELGKENAELKCECRRCVYTDSPCILSDYGKDRNGICDYFKDVFDENAELKKSCKIQVDTAFQMIYDKDEQLTKAKEIIKKLKALYFSPVVTKDDVKRQDEILAEAEQFLNSEVKK